MLAEFSVQMVKIGSRCRLPQSAAVGGTSDKYLPPTQTDVI